jgi:hypothetical protein
VDSHLHAASCKGKRLRYPAKCVCLLDTDCREMNQIHLLSVHPSATATVTARVSGYQFREVFRGRWGFDDIVVDARASRGNEQVNVSNEVYIGLNKG